MNMCVCIYIYLHIYIFRLKCYPTFRTPKDAPEPLNEAQQSVIDGGK